jgi:hypothetical protein
VIIQAEKMPLSLQLCTINNPDGRRLDMSRDSEHPYGQNRAKRVRLNVAVGCLCLVAILSHTTSAEAKRYFMSCGFPPTVAFGTFSPGSLTYRQHPRRCFYSDDGSGLRLVNLVDIKWRSWGGRKTWARAKRVDTHDQDNNGFQRHRVRVVLSRPKARVGPSWGENLYYTRMRVYDPPYGSFVMRLFRPGLDPVYRSSAPARD